MARSANGAEVYLEVGHKRTFAGAMDWPGWCRAGRDEAAALQALLAYAPRYARAVRPARLGFQAPAAVADLVVVERLTGTATTEFGAPDVAPARDARPMDEAQLRRYQALLRAAWHAFDAAAEAATGKELRRGPRGGGRELDAIRLHVLNSEASYLPRVGAKWKAPDGVEADLGRALSDIRAVTLQAVAAAAHGEAPARGPRGGARWNARYFVRRVAWHALDHAWEIEDRAT